MKVDFHTFLSSRSVLTMTDISSVGIRLRQLNSDSKRPTPTVRSIFSFIDDLKNDLIYSTSSMAGFLATIFWKKFHASTGMGGNGSVKVTTFKQ